MDQLNLTSRYQTYYVVLPLTTVTPLLILVLCVPEQSPKGHLFVALQLHHHLDLLPFALFSLVFIRPLIVSQYQGIEFIWILAQNIGYHLSLVELALCGSKGTTIPETRRFFVHMCSYDPPADGLISSYLSMDAKLRWCVKRQRERANTRGQFEYLSKSGLNSRVATRLFYTGILLHT